jgi:hypothetical protein
MFEEFLQDLTDADLLQKKNLIMGNILFKKKYYINESYEISLPNDEASENDIYGMIHNIISQIYDIWKDINEESFKQALMSIKNNSESGYESGSQTISSEHFSESGPISKKISDIEIYYKLNGTKKKIKINNLDYTSEIQSHSMDDTKSSTPSNIQNIKKQINDTFDSLFIILTKIGKFQNFNDDVINYLHNYYKKSTQTNLKTLVDKLNIGIPNVKIQYRIYGYEIDRQILIIKNKLYNLLIQYIDNIDSIDDTEKARSKNVLNELSVEERKPIISMFSKKSNINIPVDEIIEGGNMLFKDNGSKKQKYTNKYSKKNFRKYYKNTTNRNKNKQNLKNNTQKKNKIK